MAKTTSKIAAAGMISKYESEQRHTHNPSLSHALFCIRIQYPFLLGFFFWSAVCLQRCQPILKYFAKAMVNILTNMFTTITHVLHVLQCTVIMFLTFYVHLYWFEL